MLESPFPVVNNPIDTSTGTGPIQGLIFLVRGHGTTAHSRLLEEKAQRRGHLKHVAMRTSKESTSPSSLSLMTRAAPMKSDPMYCLSSRAGKRTDCPDKGSQMSRCFGMSLQSGRLPDEQRSRRPSRESARHQLSTEGSEPREKSRQRATAGSGGTTGRKVGSTTGRGDWSSTRSRYARPPLQMKNPRICGGCRRRKRRRKAGPEATRRQRRQTRAAARARSAGEGRRRRISSRSASSRTAVASPSPSPAGGAGLRHFPRIWWWIRLALGYLFVCEWRGAGRLRLGTRWEGRKRRGRDRGEHGGCQCGEERRRGGRR